MAGGYARNHVPPSAVAPKTKPTPVPVSNPGYVKR
jgi:hypothetical protein